MGYIQPGTDDKRTTNTSLYDSFIEFGLDPKHGINVVRSMLTNKQTSSHPSSQAFYSVFSVHYRFFSYDASSVTAIKVAPRKVIFENDQRIILIFVVVARFVFVYTYML